MMRLLRVVMLVCISILQHSAFATGNKYEVVIVMGKEDIPADAKPMGTIKIGDNGFKLIGDYERTMGQVRGKALDKGANLVCITQLKHPDMWSTCYRVRAEVYYVADMEAFKKHKRKQLDSVLQAMLPKDAPYALLYVYRPYAHVGRAEAYNIHVNEAKVCRVTNESKYVVQLQPGKTNIWTKTEVKDEMNIDVQPGKVYFLRCGLRMGWLLGRPDINLVDAYQGLQECNSIDLSEPANDPGRSDGIYE